MIWSLNAHRPRSRRGTRRRQALQSALFEQMEERTLLSSFVVTNTGDNGGIDPAPNASTGTLRQAIVDANANPGSDAINFRITSGTIGENPVPTASSVPV